MQRRGDLADGVDGVRPAIGGLAPSSTAVIGQRVNARPRNRAGAGFSSLRLGTEAPHGDEVLRLQVPQSSTLPRPHRAAQRPCLTSALLPSRTTTYSAWRRAWLWRDSRPSKRQLMGDFVPSLGVVGSRAAPASQPGLVMAACACDRETTARVLGWAAARRVDRDGRR